VTGAGGKGGKSRTKAIDEVAAKAYISASLAAPSVKKFLLVSYIAVCLCSSQAKQIRADFHQSRKGYPPWWSDEDKKAADKVNNEILPDYYKAKVEADEHLEALTKKRLDGGDKDFQAINLRPGTLTDDPATGKVILGKTSSRGSKCALSDAPFADKQVWYILTVILGVSREDVARVAAALLERNDTRGWIDLLEGNDSIEEAVEKVVKSNHDGLEGEDMDRIWARAT
jgi:hypothetical protein